MDLNMQKRAAAESISESFNQGVNAGDAAIAAAGAAPDIAWSHIKAGVRYAYELMGRQPYLFGAKLPKGDVDPMALDYVVGA